MAYQIGAMMGMASLAKTRLAMSKYMVPYPIWPVLMRMACHLPCCEGCRSRTILLSPALSCLSSEGHKAGLLAVAEEVFADRTYMPDGQLTPRARDDAMIHDADEALLNVSLCLLRARCA